MGSENCETVKKKVDGGKDVWDMCQAPAARDVQSAADPFLSPLYLLHNAPTHIMACSTPRVTTIELPQLRQLTPQLL